MQTKRILVIEESEVVRETLAIILGGNLSSQRDLLERGRFRSPKLTAGRPAWFIGLRPRVRILLAKQLVERNGGNMILDYADSEKDLLKMEFLIA